MTSKNFFFFSNKKFLWEKESIRWRAAFRMEFPLQSGVQSSERLTSLGIMGEMPVIILQLRTTAKPLDNPRTMVPRGARGTLNRYPITPRSVSFQDENKSFGWVRKLFSPSSASNYRPFQLQQFTNKYKILLAFCLDFLHVFFQNGRI